MTLRTGQPVRDVVMGLYSKRNPEPRWILVNSEPMFSPHTQIVEGAMVNFVDITAHKWADVALRESEERYRKLADGAPVGILIHRQGSLLYVNAAGLRRFGYEDPSEMLGTSVLDHVAAQCGDQLVQRVAAIAHDTPQTWSCEITCVRKDGTEFPALVQAMGTRLPDGPASVAFLLDLTERKQIEDAQRLMALGQLAGGIAHDFNNLLAAMSMNAELVGFGPASPQARELADVVLRATARGTRICRNLMAFALPDEPQREPRRIEDCIDAALRIADRQLQVAGVRVEPRYGPDPKPVLVDAGQMEEVFLNLIINALHAMPGGGTLTVATRYLPAENGNGQVVAVVTDTGTGIAPEHLPRIFEPFFTTKGRLGQSDTPGTGLGLSVSHGIVSAHGGTISVRSEVGVGTSSEVSLPLHVPAE